MAIHRLYIDGSPPLVKGPLEVTGEEARHAVRVKRVGEGEQVEVLDGAGRVAAARVLRAARDRAGNWALRLEVEAVRTEPALLPRVEAWTALPKGPRLAELIDGISQAGAAAWRPLACERSVAEAGEHKAERARRLAAEACKQAGRPWLLEVGEPASFAEAMRAAPATRLVLADASGQPYDRAGTATVRLLIGPEGGWTAAELAAARQSGAAIARFGPHTMRIETAAVVAAAIVLDRETSA